MSSMTRIWPSHSAEAPMPMVGMATSRVIFAAKGSAISKAISIIDNGLRASLDKEAGGEIAANLDALYDYMSRRLLHANLKNDVTIIDEVHGLLADLRGAWVEIGDKVQQPQQVAAPTAMPKAPTLASA